MATGFSGYPETIWNGNNNDRDMTLKFDFSFTDKNGKIWTSPAGSFVNGATIPPVLWSVIGSPYTGKYRRASVVHDYFVGEDVNPDVPLVERKEADRMFHEACLFDGCNPEFAATLYIAVCIGTWNATRPRLFKFFKRTYENITEHPDDKMIQAKFHEIMFHLKDDLKDLDFDALHERLNGGILDGEG